MNFYSNIIKQKLICDELPLAIHYKHDGSVDECGIITDISETILNNHNHITYFSEFPNSYIIRQDLQCRLVNKNFLNNFKPSKLCINRNNSHNNMNNIRGMTFTSKNYLILHCSEKHFETNEHCGNAFNDILPVLYTLTQYNQRANIIFLIEHYRNTPNTKESYNNFCDHSRNIFNLFDKSIYIE